jgi:hypothetical protein
MKEFTLHDGNPVSINLSEVDYFQPADDGTYIAFKDGRSITVDEDYEDVRSALEPNKA